MLRISSAMAAILLDLLEREHSIYKFRHIVMKEQNKFQKHALNSQEYFNMFYKGQFGLLLRQMTSHYVKQKFM